MRQLVQPRSIPMTSKGADAVAVTSAGEDGADILFKKCWRKGFYLKNLNLFVKKLDVKISITLFFFEKEYIVLLLLLQFMFYLFCFVPVSFIHIEFDFLKEKDCFVCCFVHKKGKEYMSIIVFIKLQKKVYVLLLLITIQL